MHGAKFNALFSTQVAAFSAKAKPKHKLKMKIHGEQRFVRDIPEGLGGKKTLVNGPMRVNVVTHLRHLYSLKS